jgi:hypothetical protein
MVAMPIRNLVACLVVVAGLAALAPAAHADNFVVNDGGYSSDANPGNGTCADSGGKCTLNAAIQEGNFRAGSHTITFTVPVVTLQGALAQLRAPFTITGTLPLRTVLNGYNGANHFPCFSLTDSGDIPTGHFNDGANGSTIANMVIVGCNGDGISANGHGWTFVNNYIGLASDGVTSNNLLTNSGHGISVSSSRVYSQETSQFLLDLYAAFPAQPVSTADVANFAAQLTTILANAMLGPVLITGNVISGNTQNGVEIFSENIAGVFVTGNMIGTDVTGNVAVPNGQSGVHSVGSPFANMISGNVISGNAAHGINWGAGKVALPNFIMANRIGLSATNPLASVGNGLSGITTDTAPEDAPAHFNPSFISLIIGPANVIGDNQGENNNAFPDVLGADNGGIVVTGASKGVKIRGNTIGIGEFPPGTPVASKSYGNKGDGIIVTVSDVDVGGSGSGDGNVVAANARHGIVIRGSSVTGTKVIGNSIGVHPALAGNLALGNGVDGIHNNGASTALIGGAGATDANTIAGNGRNGVKFRNGNASNGWSNLLQRNKVYGNAKGVFVPAGVGIDLDFLENAANPLHGEFLGGPYAQLDQAQPVICAGAPGEPAACAGFTPPSAGAGTSLDWTIQTHGPATLRMEFFKIDTADPNTSTSMTFLGEQTITTDIFGVPDSAGCAGGRCSASVGGSAAGGYIVMTANDVTPITNVPGGSGWLAIAKCIVLANCFVNDTSEFSNAAQPSVATTTAVTAVPATSVFGEAVNVTATVTAGAGPAPTGSVTINAGGSSCSAALGSPVGSASSGTCTLAPNLPVGGPVAVTATFAAQNGFLGSSSSGGGNGSHTVNKAGTTAAITADTPDPSTVGAAYSVTVSVVPVAPGAGTPGGAITVSDGTDNCVITLPAPSCNLTSTTSGAKTLVATYAGDASFSGSVSAGVAHQVNAGGPTATTTAVTQVNPATAVFGQAVSITVQVTASGGAIAPDGSVTVTAGASTCNVTLAPVGGLVAGGSCNLALPLNVQASAYTVSAAYAGNASFAGSVSSGAGNGSLTVNKASTTTAITADTPDPSNVNAAYAVTVAVAAVAPGAGTPGGTITVSDGTDNCVITLPATSCNLTSTTSGAKTLTATYGGNASFNGSASAGVAHQVNPGGGVSTTTAVTLVNPATAVYGQGVSVTVQVTAGSGAVSPDGSVTITAGASTCNATLAPVAGLVAGGSCNLTPAPVAQVGAYTVSASYAGNATFAASSSSGAGNGSLTVNKASTTAAITADTPDPSNQNAAYAVTVVIAPVAPGAGSASGNVTVSDGTDNCVITLPAASCNLTSTTTGAKTLVATYAGDANFNGSVSAGVAHQVNPGGGIATTTAVTLVNPPTSVFGQAVNVTVQVTAGSGALAPDGAVTVTAGASTCNVTLAPVGGLVAGGSCALAPPPGAQVGAYTVGASYAGTATFAASASSGAGNGTLTVDKAATTVAVSDAPDPTNVGVPYVVTSTVSVNAPGAGTPTGTINVSDGTDSCTITLPATACNLTSTTGGAKTLTAQYGGDASFLAGSATTPHTVTVVTSFSGPTVAPGVTGTATLAGGVPNCSLANPQFIAVAPLTPPPGVAFPFGLFDFNATGCTVGATISIQIVYSQPLPAGTQYWKWGPTPGNLVAHWYQMPGSNVSGNTVTFSITDGGIGDDDVTANGTIVDQGGPGTPPGGGQGTGALQIPTLGELALAMLALLLASLGASRLRRRR